MKPKRTIRVRLIAIIICSVLVPLGVLGGVYQISVKKILINNSNLMMSQTLDETVIKVEEYLKNLSQPLDMLSQQTALKEYVDTVGTKANKEATEKLREQLEVVHGALEGTINVYLGTPNGHLLVSTKNGDSDYSFDMMEVGFTSQEWYVDAIGKERIQGVKAIFQKPYIDDVTGQTVVTLTQEVVFDGKVYGVLGLDIDFTSFENYVEEIKLLNTGYVMMSDENGMVLSNHKLSNITEEVPVDENDDIIGTTKAETKRIVSPDVFKNLKEDDIYSYEIEKETQYTKIVSEPITGWKLLGVISESENSGNISKLRSILWITTLIGVMVAIVISTMLTNTILKVLRKIGSALKEVAKGNLQIQLESKRNDEIGELENDFNEMVIQVGSLVRDVSEQTNIMVEAGEKIAKLADETTRYTKDVVDTITEVADGATEQAQNTQEATSKVGSLSECINGSEEIINDIERMRAETNQLSKEGLATVESLIYKAELTKENSNLSKEVFDEMASSIQNIDYISNAIADITTQTNLLSLNASIEAARAGEAGKGFAVVADEIRQLAEQSKESTDQIKRIVAQISDKSDLAGEKLLESNHMIDEQNEAIIQTKQVFHKISDAITMLSTHINQMMLSTKEMNQMKDAVSDNINEIAAISEEYAASTEEVTAASEQVMNTMNVIAEQTKELNRITDLLKEDIEKFSI